MAERVHINIKDFIVSSRTELAVLNLKKDPHYMEICQEQEVSGKVVDEILAKLGNDERLTVLRHYEGEVHKSAHEFDAIYIQGLRDCIKALAFLGVFDI